ncbi:MAG: helix-turn-helix transcriptional regulator [Alphaproteobacteria bacterium]|nr:helix-turn-helix transcriptional regulator [Alphaproteobacteria bacterium]
MEKIKALSPRESEILKWTACGKSYEEISDVLDLSKETVRTQMKSACKKLNASNKAQAVAIALTHGILSYGPSPERVITLNALFGLSKHSPDSSAAAGASSHAPAHSTPKKHKGSHG